MTAVIVGDEITDVIARMHGICNGEIPDLSHGNAIGRVVDMVIFHIVSKTAACVHVVSVAFGEFRR